MKKLTNFVPKAKALSKFSKIFGDIVNPFDGTNHLDFLEKFGKKGLVCLGGYSRLTNYPSSHFIFSSLIEIANWILVSRLIILSITSDYMLSFYLGDIFYGTKTRFHMNAVIAIGSIMLGVSRTFSYWLEQLDQMKWLSYFADIQKHGFRADMLHISQGDLKILRNRIYLGRQFFTFFTPITILVLGFIFTYSIINNPVSYSSPSRLAFILLWTVSTFIAAVGAVISVLWLIVHIYVLIVYTILRLDYVDRLASGLLKLPVIPVNLIRSLVSEQIQLFNAIDAIDSQLRNFFFFGYNFAAFGTDFLLYVAFTMPKDNLFNNILVFGLGVEVTFIICIIVYLSGTIHIRVSI